MKLLNLNVLHRCDFLRQSMQCKYILFHPTEKIMSMHSQTFLLLSVIKITKPVFFKKKLVFTPCKVEQPLRDMELQEKEAQKG